ncbi:MAG TPA: hypothetical protein VMY76_12920 [Gemmatimonadales bacterium]|nr:hypothetical protein [Gemmatimonadales bacterium]
MRSHDQRSDASLAQHVARARRRYLAAIYQARTHHRDARDLVARARYLMSIGRRRRERSGTGTES